VSCEFARFCLRYSARLWHLRLNLVLRYVRFLGRDDFPEAMALPQLSATMFEATKEWICGREPAFGGKSTRETIGNDGSI
jgi:hypothetical protein